jgi:predicted DNA-binding transcriptional regulator AlpA
MINICNKNQKLNMGTMDTTNAKIVLSRTNHIRYKLTDEFKELIEKRTRSLFVNKEFVEFIQLVVSRMQQRDQLACLHFFKKLAIQVRRTPDPDHFEAFEDEYQEALSLISEEQKFYEPVRWIEAEIEYRLNTAKHITSDEVDRRIETIQKAKQQLNKPWLSKEDMMAMFGFSKSTLNRRIAEGMPCEKHGRIISFCLEDVSNWLKGEAA